MIRWLYPGSWRARLVRLGWLDDRAAQLVEFAVSLPVLVLFVVGIFDFSSAFTLKQKLTNIARDAARVAAADPANDLTQPQTPLPASVADALQVVDNYLQANKINDCGIGGTPTPAGLTWTFTANGNGCPAGGITLLINRGYYFPQTGAVLPTVSCTSQPVPNNQITIVATCVSIQYTYQWRFGRVASLFGTTTLPSALTAIGVAMNEN
ncbi:MAG TPA: TadE/TadG family type IV pilus assembly protein [Candidatus Sulfotelmatobacter sp.]|nr:TadE/TadG family type IV pilus assembly protein [Candidatus Sulfotelmatobacter sp.]